jgi:hypothetical protein
MAAPVRSTWRRRVVNDALPQGQQVDVTALPRMKSGRGLHPHCVPVMGDAFDRGMTTFYPASPRTLPI